MPTTTPIGPGVHYVKAETTPFTFAAFTTTDAIRHLGIPQIGDGFRERKEIEISRGDRGSYHDVLGAYNNPESTIEIPFFGSGTAGTPVAARQALLESAAGLNATVSGGTSVTYEADEANPATTVSQYYVDREAIFGQYLIGHIVTSLGIELDRENAPKMVFAGKAARKWEVFKTTIGAALDDSSTSIAMADSNCIRTGDETAALTGLEIYVKIDSEIVKVTGFNRTSKVATIARAQFSTSAAAHDNGSTVTPYAETPTYGESGLLMGPHDWTVSDGESLDFTKFSLTLETGRAFNPLHGSNAAASKLHNETIKGTGSFSFILDNAQNDFYTKMDQGTDLDLKITIGSTAGSIFEINLDAVRIIDGVPKGIERNGVAEVTCTFRTRDTATALLGQLQMVFK